MKSIWWIAGLGAAGVWLASRAASAAPMAEPTGPVPPAPPAPAGPETGTQFFARVRGLSQAAQDQAALDAAARGNVVVGWTEVPVTSGALRGTVTVMSDFFGVGTPADWMRWPLTPISAQHLADAFDAVLPTRKIAQSVLGAATKIDMPTYAPPHTIEMYQRANDLAVRRIAGRTGLIDGEKKYVLAADSAHPGKVIIWGGWNASGGGVWQPYSYIHSDTYEDYSHGIRLVKRQMTVAGVPRDILDVMRDPTLAGLVSDVRTDRNTRYRA